MTSRPADGAAVLEPKDARRARVDELERLTELFENMSHLSHEINNLLTGLLGRAQLLRMRNDIGPEVQRAAVVIDETATAITGHVRNLAEHVREGRRGSVVRLQHIERTGEPPADE